MKTSLGYIPSDPYFYENWTGKAHFEFYEKAKGKSPLLAKLKRNFVLTTR
jgi:ABC-type multidrug transport system ATPase subunit